MLSPLPQPPVLLPIPRQPSPLSISSLSHNELDDSGPSFSLDTSPYTLTQQPKPSSMVVPNGNRPEPDRYSPVHESYQDGIPQGSSSRQLNAFPIDPLPDSILLRSTFTHLEHSASTIKKLSKEVLASASSYLALLSQVDKAEDDFLSTLGELARWLEGGYGLSGQVWTEDGFKKLRKERRRKEQEQVEVMVEHNLKQLRDDLKRRGSAGSPSQATFEVSHLPRVLLWPDNAVSKTPKYTTITQRRTLLLTRHTRIISRAHLPPSIPPPCLAMPQSPLPTTYISPLPSLTERNQSDSPSSILRDIPTIRSCFARRLRLHLTVWTPW
jgi:hypothetical protein